MHIASKRVKMIFENGSFFLAQWEELPNQLVNQSETLAFELKVARLGD